MNNGVIMKNNCWEFYKCSRGKGGSKVSELGVCRVVLEERLDKVNGGRNGGRACWSISGTFCNGEIQGEIASKLKNCFDCEFYKKVLIEEGQNFIPFQEIVKKL